MMKTVKHKKIKKRSTHMHTKTELNHRQILFVNIAQVNGVRGRWLQGFLGGWHSLTVTRMVKQSNRVGQTLCRHSADSFRCLVMPLAGPVAEDQLPRASCQGPVAICAGSAW